MDCQDDSAASNENFKFVKRSCYVPEIGFFISALRTELKCFFEEVTIQYVECPDLTQPPYRLAVPGLCGNTGQLIAGKFTAMYPFPQSDKIYNFKKILRKIKRNKINTFLLGSGLCFSMTPQEVMCTVSINTLFSPKDGEINVTNESRGAFVIVEKDDSSFFRERRNINDIIGFKPKNDNRTRDDTRKKLSTVYALDPIREQNHKFSSCIINNPDPECVMCGMCFISEGQPGQVLKIHVKKRIDEFGFTAALSKSLSEIKEYIDDSPIGLGGTFMMSGENVATVVMPSFPPNPLDNVEIIEGSFYRKNVAAESLVAVGAVTSEYNPYLTFCTFNQYEACGIFDEQNSNDVTEYLGYFSLIENIYEFWHEPIINQFPPKTIDTNLQARCPDDK